MSRISTVEVARLPGLFFTLSFIGAASAGYANQVVLVGKGDDTRLGGELLSFDGETYEIKTVLGTIAAPASAVLCEGDGCPVEQITYSWGEPKIGEQVTITTNNGSVTLVGTLQAFDGDKTQVSTQIGDFTIPMNDANCAGPGCPEQIETVTFVLPEAGAVAAPKVEDTSDQSSSSDTSTPEVEVARANTDGQRVTDTFYPDTGSDTPYEIEPEIRMAGPGEIVEVMMPIALENYAWRHNGILDLYDDHMATTEDIGEMKHHAGGVGFEIKDAGGERLLGLLGHHAHVPLEQIKMLANEETDVAFLTGPPNAEELAMVANAGHGDLSSADQQRVVAVDGFVGIVSPQNSINSIALSDLQRVFAGQVTNWSQIGGADAPINVYTFPTGHETFYKARDVLLAPAGLEISPDAQELRLTRQIVEQVVSDPNGIAFVSYARRRGAKPLSLVMNCGLEIEASPLTIKTERYPLVQRIAAYSRSGQQDELVEDFLNFVGSSDFDSGVENAGFVSLGVAATSLLQDSKSFAAQIAGYKNASEISRAREVLTMMLGGSSLTAAFRFNSGSAGLDQRAQRDLLRVADYIKANPDAQYSVVGFADSSGGFDQNELLSLRRAQTVVDALRRADTSGKLDGMDLPAIGGGELNSVACNNTPAERATNRRVEIWMKS